LFDIRLELSEGIVYEPEIAETTGNQLTVRNALRNWINDFFTIAGTISRLDTTVPGDFLSEIRSYFEIKDCQNQITQHLDFIESECNDFREKFNVYSYLWTENE
jgi:hypothetical protein